MAKSKTIKVNVTATEHTEVIDSIGDLQTTAKPGARHRNRVKKVLAALARKQIEGKVNMSNVSKPVLKLDADKGATRVSFALAQGDEEQTIHMDLKVAA